MNDRQREIFAELSAGIDLKKWKPAKKRATQTQAPVSVAPIPKKPKLRDQQNIELSEGVRLFRGRDSSEKESQLKSERSSQGERAMELERAAAIRKAHGIKVSSASTAPCPFQSFEEVEAKVPALKGLAAYAGQQGFHTLTPIQMQAISAMLQQRDIVGIAPTGSGKTLAFLLPILAHIKKQKAASCVQVLVISPTCELSAQTHQTFIHLQRMLNLQILVSTFLLDKDSKKRLKNKQPDVLFSTPFGLIKQIKKGRIDVSQARFLILDEADRLFSMEKKAGKNVEDMKHYVAQLDSIVAACQNKELVKAMFSATFPPNVSDLANNILVNPLCVTVGKKNAVVPSVKQHLMYTGSERGKLLAIRQIFAKGISPPVVVFVDTKDRANALLSELRIEGICAERLHSQIEIHRRNRILQWFQDGEIWVLIATDLVSRGIDFVGVHMVINYDFPKSTTDYIHRIGRTGRAGRAGESYTFFTDSDKGYIRPIANTIKEAGGDVPDWMTTLERDNWKNKRSYGAIGQDKETV